MKNVRIVVVGDGWGGCVASVGAARAGADVVLLERTETLVSVLSEVFTVIIHGYCFERRSNRLKALLKWGKYDEICERKAD